MTINSNYDLYSTYGAYSVAAERERNTPDFEAIAQKMMEAIDTDGSGTIEQAEFTAMATSSESSDLTYNVSLEDIFRALDSNSDGSMSTEELASALQGMGPSGGGQVGAMPPPPPPPSGDESETSEDASSTEGIFDPLDTNQDGIVSAAEYAAGVNLAEAQTEVSLSASDDTQLNADLFQRMLAYYGNNATTQEASASLLSISV